MTEAIIPIKCTNCGRFIGNVELDTTASQLYIPETRFTKEENKIHCGKCTEAIGQPTSEQLIGLELYYKLQ